MTAGMADSLADSLADSSASSTAGTPMAVDLMVIAKEPVPGRAKTRLTPPCSPAEAAGLAAAALDDTLAAVAATPATRRTLVLAGTPGDGLPACVRVLPQRGDGLDERLANAFADVDEGRPVVLIGMDTPQVTPALLLQAMAALTRCDAVFGPAADGGFWSLGLRNPAVAYDVLPGVPMSRSDTGRALLRRLAAAGLKGTTLPELTDVDTAADAVEVAGLAPDGRFAEAVRRLGCLPRLEGAAT